MKVHFRFLFPDSFVYQIEPCIILFFPKSLCAGQGQFGFCYLFYQAARHPFCINELFKICFWRWSPIGNDCYLRTRLPVVFVDLLFIYFPTLSKFKRVLHRDSSISQYLRVSALQRLSVDHNCHHFSSIPWLNCPKSSLSSTWRWATVINLTCWFSEVPAQCCTSRSFHYMRFSLRKSHSCAEITIWLTVPALS